MHTFGSETSLTVNGLPIHYADPSDITTDKRIRVDDYLNDVRLYLPYFTVKSVVDELQNTEGGEIPTVIDEGSLENQVYVTLTVHPTRKRGNSPIPGQTVISDMGARSTRP